MADLSLSAKNVVKHYGGVVALSDGNLEVNSGEVHALIGANGSGKSTLSKIITGVVAPDQGQLLLDGESESFPSPQDAKKRGITAVYQDLSLIPDMTVSENIWLTQEPLSWGGVVKDDLTREKTEELLELFEGTFQQSLHPDAPIAHLPPDERQIVEILKAYSQSPRLLILDEATARLDNQQVNRLFDLIGQWKGEGMALVFVTHRMEEIFRVADCVTVLRNGESVGTFPIDETDERKLVELMIEGEAEEQALARADMPEDSPVRMKIEGLKTDVLKGISLEVRDGELLGIAGLQGMGQEDLLLSAFGAIPYEGQLVYAGDPVELRHPRQAMSKGIAFVPGDRATEGLLLIRSILENFQLPSWKRYGIPLLDVDEARNDALETADNLRLVRESMEAPVSSLSGGNAQKVVIGKWLLREPQLLLLNDPTKGVDVGAKSEFYRLLADLRDQGTAIMFYSSEDDELLRLCDRILVLYDGAIRAELTGDDITRANLIEASLGTNNHQVAE